MKEPVIVFDFDKTLTNKDTLFGFYEEASRSELLFKIKYPFFILTACAFKLGLISNLTLKKAGVWFYLKGLTRNEVKEIGANYSRKIELNTIYEEEFLKFPSEQVIIISASFEDYLKPLFPEHRVVGSRLEYGEDSVVSGISVNMFGKKKREWLERNGIKQVDIFYTDSLSDAPVIEVSNRVILVKGSSKQNIK